MTAVPSTGASSVPNPAPNSATPSDYQVLHPHPSTQARPGPHGQNTLDVTVVLPCYNEQDHVLLEIERILLPSWQIVTHVSALRKTGDYATLDIGPESVFVITAFELRGKAKKAFRRRQRRKRT